MAGLSFFTEPFFAKSNYWLNVLLLDEDVSDRQEDVLKKTNDNGIKTRPVWTLMNKLIMYKDCPAMDLGCAESLEKRIINIPSSATLMS